MRGGREEGEGREGGRGGEGGRKGRGGREEGREGQKERGREELISPMFPQYGSQQGGCEEDDRPWMPCTGLP